MDPKLKDNKGVTLLEVIISIALISAILMGLFMTIDNTNRSNVKNDKDIKAMDIAQSEIESIIKDIKEGSTIISLNNGETQINLDNVKEIKQGDIYHHINTESFHQGEEYDKALTNKDTYEINVYMGKTKNEQQAKGDYYVYRVCISVKSNSDFSDRDTVIQTEVLQKF